jgi:predicted enzyme related to lactoylglutathione lyase
MIKGYQDFYYNVFDMDKSVAFYENAFAMKKVFGDKHWSVLTIGNLRLGLHWSENKGIPLTPRNGHGQDSGGTLTLLSDDIKGDKTKIENAGGIILGEADMPWGHMLVFEDIDRNVLKLMNPKY